MLAALRHHPDVVSKSKVNGDDTLWCDFASSTRPTHHCLPFCSVLLLWPCFWVLELAPYWGLDRTVLYSRLPRLIVLHWLGAKRCWWFYDKLESPDANPMGLSRCSSCRLQPTHIFVVKVSKRANSIFLFYTSGQSIQRWQTTMWDNPLCVFLFKMNKILVYFLIVNLLAHLDFW